MGTGEEGEEEKGRGGGCYSETPEPVPYECVDRAKATVSDIDMVQLPRCFAFAVVVHSASGVAAKGL